MFSTLMHIVTADPTVESLVANIQHGDTKLRYAAVSQATLVGTSAIPPLGKIYGDDDPAAAKAALEALTSITHHAARPGAKKEAQQASTQLIRLLGKEQPRHVRADAIKLLGCVGGKEASTALATLLADTDIREDARMALERISDSSAESALTRAARTCPADYRPAIDQSLAHRKRKWGTAGKKA